ncbi:hypothetical protein OESDEN_03355 [Oesophagostomum dentatum]|uniref:Uncharacterized protein n=1 Tax=Oesophagostomum dentatum TaxID=61180 RepID=A0A0B1TGN9_OESDE|nr:hypothetical protein OESDEN_03355 [Oesophagostomum dentatum]
MAILGFHIVVSLIALTVMSKLGTRLSIIQLFIVKGLYRFIAPSNDDIRALMPPSKDNPRARKKKREEEETEGFNVPKSLPLRLRLGRVEEEELKNLPLYSSVHWLSLFVPLCLVVYSMSEVFSFLFPNSNDTNVAILWLLIAVAFVLQVSFALFLIYIPFPRFALHLTFLLPLLSLLSFASPVKKQLVYGPRKLLTEDQLDILRIYLAILSFICRVALRAPHFQAHLNLSRAKLNALQHETGYIRNVALQAMIFRYYSYFCAVILQYFSPVLLSLYFALLLKTTGNLSWLGTPVDESLSQVTAGSLRSIFDATVCRAIWSFSLVFVTFTNVVLSFMGVMYNSYFLPL